jgi:diguanylate cyclase (GGDEF)-like protein
MARSCIHSIRLKASALVVLIVVLVTCVGTTSSVRETRRAMFLKELVRISTWANFLAVANADELARGDKPALQELVRSLVDSGRVVYIAIAGPDGQIITSAEGPISLLARHQQSSGRLKIDDVGQPKLYAPTNGEVAYADICAPIYYSRLDPRAGNATTLQGYLRFGVNVSDTAQSLALISRKYFENGAVLLLLLIPLCLVLTQRVLSPVSELARAARAIASGSMDARAQVDSRDEIGELAQMFNEMAQRVTESRLELIELNAELEERVRQRTTELAELASRDPLTGLYNRRHFGEVITREFAAAERYGDDLTCLMFDVDHFKAINDQYGHRTGDNILMALASAIAGELRGADVAARFGGDEFVLVLPQTESVSAANLADRISQRFENEVHRLHPGITPTLSIGAASLRTTRARSSESLIHEADLALYAAKQGGRNRLMEASTVD